MNDHYDNITAAADHYGLCVQMSKTVEELGELIVAIQRRQFDGEGGIYEEMADVYNMLDQICYLTGHEDDVQDIAEAKMRRTMDHIMAKN